jgi:hypothetical protein
LPTVKYIGPFDAVEIPSLNRVVAKGEEIDVPQEAVSGLAGQTDAWEVVEG